MSTSTSRADLARVRRWLTTLHGGAPGQINVCATDEWAGRHFTTDDAGITAAVEYVGRLDAQGKAGIYARVTTLRHTPERGRGAADLSLSFPALFADIDIDGPGHQHKVCPADCSKGHTHKVFPLPPNYSEAKRIATESGLPEPTLWIDSGGGLYPYWFLDQAHQLNGDLDTVSAMSARWQLILKASAERLGYHYGEGVGDLTRVLRIPGTVNRKTSDPRLCDTAEFNGVAYPLDELAAIANGIELPAAAGPGPRPFVQPPSRPNLMFTSPGSVGPFDALAEVCEWRDLLEPAGFFFVRSERDGAELWKYSGASPASEYSVRCGYNGAPVLVNHSESTPLPVGAGQKLTMGRLYAQLHHRGDETAAAKDLRAAAAGDPSASAAHGLPVRILDHIRQRCDIPPWVATRPEPALLPQAAPPAGPDPRDPYDLIPAQPTAQDHQRDREQRQEQPDEQQEPTSDGPADVRHVMAAATEADVLRGVFPSRDHLAVHPWTTPGSDDQADTQLPSFPVHCLPGDVSKFAQAVAVYAQVPVDVVALAMLGALGAVVGGHATISGQWTERNLNLFAASLLESGEGKSRAFGEVTPPVYELEKDLRRAWDDNYGSNDEALQVANMTRDKVIKELVGAAGNKRAELQAELDELKSTIKELAGPSRPQLLIGDTTPEALGHVMFQQGGHIGHISAEGALLGVALGRYNNGKPNIELLLTSFDSSEPYRLNRIGRELFEIDRPSLALSLSVQPVVITDALASAAVVDRGLLNRFLFALPESLAGGRDMQPARVPSYLTEAWARCVKTAFYVVLPDGNKYDEEGELRPPTPLQVSADAELLHLDWRRRLEARVDPDTGDLAAIKGWIGRLPGAAYRIAALLHLAAGHRPSQAVTGQTMADALEISDYCIPHALAVLGGPQRAAGGPTDEASGHVLGWIRRKGIDEFTVEVARRGVRGRAWCKQHGAQGVRAVLVSLAAQGWLASVERSDEQGRRQPDGLFVSHPELLRSVA